jgi:hypothetical protein
MSGWFPALMGWAIGICFIRGEWSNAMIVAIGSATFAIVGAIAAATHEIKKAIQEARITQ